jgi:hypothetical protein
MSRAYVRGPAGVNAAPRATVKEAISLPRPAGGANVEEKMPQAGSPTRSVAPPKAAAQRWGVLGGAATPIENAA